MFKPTRSLIVILILSINLLVIDCAPTVVSKTSTYMSPSRKMNNFGMARSSNLQAMESNNLNLKQMNGTLKKVNEETPQELQSNGSFTNDDVQTTLTNDKQIDSNLTNSDSKLFNENSANKDVNVKNNENNFVSQYGNIASTANLNEMINNIPIAQVDTFNSNENLYSAINSIQCQEACSKSYDATNYEILQRCCSIGYDACCNNNLKNNQQNFESQNDPSINKPTNVNSVSNSENSVNQVNSVNPVNPVNTVNNNANSNSPNNVNSINHSPTATNNRINQHTHIETYGTKTAATKGQSKQQSPISKLKNPQENIPIDDNIDARQALPNYYTTLAFNSALNSNPSLLNNLFMNPKDRFLYSNGMTGLPFNLQYSNLNELTNSNGLNMFKNPNSNFYANTNNIMNTNLNSDSNGNSFGSNANQNNRDVFSRKTSNSNRAGTKTAGASNVNLLNENLDQSKNTQSIVNNDMQLNQNANPSILITSSTSSINNPSSNQATGNSQQRLNNRNPNESGQQQSQGGISNAFNSIFSHIPFIGFNPIHSIPVVFKFSSPSSTQQQQQMNTQNQVAQILTTNDLNGNLMDNTQNIHNYPYATVNAMRSQLSNEQFLTNQQSNVNQLPVNNNLQTINTQTVNSQLQTKTNQPTSNQQSTGFASTIINSPYNLYQRYFARPTSDSPKLGLLYGNKQFLEIPSPPPEWKDFLNEQNLLNLKNFLQNYQFYSQSINSNLMNSNQNGFENNFLGQMNPILLGQLMQNEKLKEQSARSAKRS